MRVFQEADIIPALRRIVENNNLFYPTDFNYDAGELKDVAAGSRYLWLSHKSGTMLYKERDAHITNHEAYYSWQYYSDTQYYGVKAFAVEVTENDGGRPFGNIYELHYGKDREAIAQTRFHARTVDVTFTSGDARTFEMVEYNDNCRAIVNRYGAVKSVKYNLSAEDEAKLDAVLSEIKAKREEEAEPANFGAYVREMVRERFHGYGYTQDDMAFTTPEDARAALKHHIPAYILYPDNTAQPLETPTALDKAVYDGRMLGMNERDKRLLRFYKAGNTLADLPFTHEELSAIFYMALDRGKANIEDDQQREAVDGIIKVLDTLLFSDDGRDSAQIELDNGLDAGAEI